MEDKQTRYRLVRDSSYRWFLVPVGREKEFKLWQKYISGKADYYRGPVFRQVPDFNKLTFSDPIVKVTDND